VLEQIHCRKQCWNYSIHHRIKESWQICTCKIIFLWI